MKRQTLGWVIVVVFCIGTARGAETEAGNAAPQPDADGWYSLFNGRDLAGWKKADENPDTIQVVDGEIVFHGPRCHLFYDGPVNKSHFKNFEWKCEILTKPKSNSGMYFHTKYQERGWPATGLEVQVNNSHGDPIKTASVYKLKNIAKSPVNDDEWFTQHVIVDGRRIVVKVNDEVVNDYTVPEDLEREQGWKGNMLGEGTFALQGHDPESEVHYRKVLVKPLP